MPENSRIAAQVAAIATDRELVLNRGAEQGVEVGMRFAILAPAAVIADPETGEKLGEIPLPKTFVKVVDVQANFSVAKTFREFVIPAQQGFMGAVSGSPSRTVVEKLRSDEPRLRDDLGPDEAVNIGDKAVQIVGGDVYVGLD